MADGSYEVMVKGGPELRVNLERAKKACSMAMDDIADDVVARIQNAITESGHSDTGQLSSNEMWTIEKTDEFTRTIKAAKEYAIYVDQGTGPAAGHEQYWPNMSALEPWCNNHGIDNVFLVARSIYRDGTEPVHFVDKALEGTEGKFSSYLDAALVKAGVTV